MNQGQPTNSSFGHVGHNHLAMLIADFKRRVVNIVDPMKLHYSSEHPHGVTDKDCDSIVPKDKYIIFNLNEYPWLLHRRNYCYINRNLYVRSYNEEGTIATPFDLRVQNDIDGFHLVIDEINRLPILGNKGSYLKQQLQDKLIEYKIIYINTVKIFQKFSTGNGKTNEQSTIKKYNSPTFCQ